jgi:hypothetical protein
VALFDVSAYALLPGRALRRRLEEGAAADARFVRFLDERGVTAVLGNYWTAYPVNFLSKERIRGVPVNPSPDWYDYAGRLPERPARWAIASWWSDERDALARTVGVPGEAAEPAPGTYVFLPHDPSPPREALARLRRSP